LNTNVTVSSLVLADGSIQILQEHLRSTKTDVLILSRALEYHTSTPTPSPNEAESSNRCVSACAQAAEAAGAVFVWADIAGMFGAMSRKCSGLGRPLSEALTKGRDGLWTKLAGVTFPPVASVVGGLGSREVTTIVTGVGQIAGNFMFSDMTQNAVYIEKHE
ncbi:hypothetical protein KIPB_005229, partial [Kipferlia bialata]